MPKRDQLFLCFCESCRETGPLGNDGEPLGVTMPTSQRIPHLTCVKAEREARRTPLPTNCDDSPLSTELKTNIFAHVLTDNGPNLNSQPSRLWTSRHEFQSGNCVPSNPICEGAIGVIAETVGRLVAETSIDHITSATEQLSIGPDAVSPSAAKLSPSERRKSKQERNKYTKRAHHTLNHMEHHAKSCLESLAHICSNAELIGHTSSAFSLSWVG